ncbi:MAG: branched-chain amino acid transaminase, partial [Thermoanaerobaculia bacterium]|nr:branched-chain amino acid transaminase [Thermoanaerobaculia bacterium]
MKNSQWCWLDGKWTRWEDANVHLTTHALHYGSSVFEGIRAYDGAHGPAVFRLGRHMRRLFDSCRMARMTPESVDREELTLACLELVERNQHGSCYLRPLVFRGDGGLGLDPTPRPIRVSILSFEWGPYLGAEALEKGVDVMISSWRRAAPDAMAALGKIGGQYVVNSLVSMEAKQNGYHEGILLDHSGHVSEGAGENLFAVYEGRLVTPPLADSILGGITRDTLMVLAQDLGVEVREERLTRDRLLIADELFMTGTAAEVTPIRSVDRIEIGAGSPGPVTLRLQG